ncbi:hypothetical protein L1987_75213 [Smallanthus sonchifolius]|uniref:Uncharacterized protein n=1 Tax=Smallanthus sonchifolius TaxID=185202 RepID=A0ACB9A529_9ASTR|nr:hypothetical protein L1987_75213 [Smallanthus sonchifolius]
MNPPYRHHREAALSPPYGCHHFTVRHNQHHHEVCTITTIESYHHLHPPVNPCSPLPLLEVFIVNHHHCHRSNPHNMKLLLSQPHHHHQLLPATIQRCRPSPPSPSRKQQQGESRFCLHLSSP